MKSSNCKKEKNLKDLLAYEIKMKQERRKALDLLTKEAQQLNLGYE